MELSYGESGSRYQGFIRKYPEAVVLAILIGLYLFLANYYAWSSTFQNFFFTTSGGSDPYFNWLTIQHFFQTGHWLMFEPSLNYPVGTTNPRNPFFQVLTVFIATLMSPFMSVNNAAFFTFEELDAFFGALLIIPVYLLGKEVFGKHGGLVAAILYVLMPSNVSTGYLSDGRIHTPELFFVLFAIFFFERAIVTIDKGKVIDRIFPPTRIVSSIYNFYKRNRLPTIYAMLSGTSLAALMLSWQGYAYAVVILLIYVLAQYILNLFLKRPSDYLVYITTITILLGFLIGAYYYIGIGNYSVWFTPILLLGILVILMGLVFMAIRGKPWVISVPVIAILGLALLAALATFDRSSFNTLLSGDGYFIKTRVYQTIAEAGSLPFGQYISSFGAFEFVIGMSGISYAIYLYFKEKKDSMFFFLVFSLVSIYMSFEAARFNITAAPSYAILGGGFLIYFAHLVKLYDMKKKSGAPSASIRKAIKGNISWVHTVYVFIIILMVISSGLSVISSAVPANTAARYNQEIYNVVPSPLQPANFTSSDLYYVGATGNLIVNATQPLSLSYSWLATQDANLPIQDKPAYVSWWDYGFQELQQGLHPSVADDFQQGFQVAGQILLAENQSQILGLFISRTMQVEYDSSLGSFNPVVNNILKDYFGANETALLTNMYTDTSAYTHLISEYPSVYGNFISSIDTANAYYALIKGQLASKYSLDTLVNAYTALEQSTGISIKYIQIPNALFPSSVNNTGTFYAPAYLTYTPSYISTGGAIVPTNYYNVIVQTTNGSSYTLNNTPTNANVSNEYLQYTPAFYNTTIYRAMVGLPASSLGLSNGIPGIVNGTQNYTAMPGWDMSNFEVAYSLSPWNPYTDYAAHPNAWQDIPLQQAYYYLVNGIGTAVLFPPTSQLVTSNNPIIAYYPGAIVTGRATLPNGAPAGGIDVTVYDQYGIPHEVTQTNAQGYYNLTAVPGNDTIVFSTGTFNSVYLYGNNLLNEARLYVSSDQAERTAMGVNTTTGFPNYYLVCNYQLPKTQFSGSVSLEYQTVVNANVTKTGEIFENRVSSGTAFLVNTTFNTNISMPIVNGAYQMNDLPPYDFMVSLLVDGTYYPDVMQANITVGFNGGYSIVANFDSIFVNVSSASGRLLGYTVKASDGSTVYSNVTDSNGHVALWVQPGTYTIYANRGSSQTSVSTVTFSTWGQNKTVNLSAALSGIVSGSIIGGSTGSILYLYPNGQISNAYTVPLESNGVFSIEVPYGVYSLYVSSGDYSYAGTVTVQSNTSITGSMSLSYSLTISASMPGITAYSGSFEIMGNSVFLKYSFSSPTTYTVMLPEGFYGVTGITNYLGNVNEGFQNVYLVGDRNLSLALRFANSLDVSFSSSTSNGPGVTSGISILYSSGNPIYFGVISSSATTLYYTNLTKVGLSTYAMSPLFTSSQTSLTGQAQTYTMSPVSVRVTLSFTSDTLKLDGVVNVTLNGQASYHFTGAESGISVNLIPGIYSVAASNTTSSLEITDPVLVVPNAVGQSFALPSVPEANFGVQATGFAVFNTSGSLVNSSLPLPFGNYLVYAFSNSTSGAMVSWGLYNLNSNLNVTPSLSQASIISLTNSLGISGGTYTVSINGGIANLSSSIVYLTGGTYGVKYYDTLSNSTGSYVISGSGSFSTSSGTTFVVSVTSTKVNAILSGTVSYRGTPLQNTVVMIKTVDGTTIAKTLTNSYGIFTMSVPTGSWEIYALNNVTGSGYFGGITIPAFSGTYYANLTLVPTYSTSVIVTIGSKVINTNVEITDYPYNMIINTTAGAILLPLGNYSFYATSSQSLQAFNGTTLSITYNVNDTYYVKSSTVITLSLSQVVKGQVSIDQTGIYPLLYTGSNVTNSTTVNFNVTNKQNVQDSVTLTSGSSAWHILFDHPFFNLAPGQTESVTATVYALDNPQAGTEVVPVNVSYSGNTVVENFNVDVVQRQSFVASITSPFGMPQGNSLIYYATLQNTGNSAITLNGSIINRDTISSLYNSNATLLYNGKAMGNVTLQYDQSVKVTILLQPIQSGFVVVTGTPVKISFNTTINGKNVTVPVSFTVEYPYASVTPYPVGSGISNYSGNALSTLITGILVIAVTVIGGIAIASYRGRRFRR